VSNGRDGECTKAGGRATLLWGRGSAVGLRGKGKSCKVDGILLLSLPGLLQTLRQCSGGTEGGRCRGPVGMGYEERGKDSSRETYVVS